MGGSWSGRSSIVTFGGTLLPRFELSACTIAFFFEAFWVLWSERVVEVGAEAEMAAWECQARELPGLLVYVMVSASAPSDVLDEPSRQQVARPVSSSWNRLWQPRLHQGEAVEDYCWILRVLLWSCRRGFGTDFAKYC